MPAGLDTEGVVLSLGLIGLGVTLTLANLGHVDLLATLRAWWPALLVAWGGLELLAVARDRSRRSR